MIIGPVILFMDMSIQINYNVDAKRCLDYGKTKIYNTYERYIFEY